MTGTEYVVGFIIAAVLTPVIILGGMTMAYFLDKHRVDPSKASVSRSASSGTPGQHRTSAGEIGRTLAPLASPMAAGSRLQPHAENDSPSSTQSKEPATTSSGGNTNVHR